MYRSIYDPSTYPQGVPNPFGPRVHAWKGGPLNEGTRFHGPVYTRPAFAARWQPRPLNGALGTRPLLPEAQEPPVPGWECDVHEPGSPEYIMCWRNFSVDYANRRGTRMAAAAGAVGIVVGIFIGRATKR